ncbi:MAG TPA: ATP-binding protein, partial [Armatimonadota bacterium]|nr:ATP-binding protein [Armatimonadota bacterium]
HILLSNIVHRAWSEGKDLDLPSLVRDIQDPPFDRVGVLDLESVYPSKDRFDLAVSLNNLLASPGFSAWLEGDPMDVDLLLHAPDGRPRLSIINIAHLSDAERMFFLTLLLNEVLAWVRRQPGTSSLRALLYMDEIFGYFPPVATPPCKRPMLMLLKQARAFGLGILLATQNPVDLDYKGLANTGTWFIGRLQTERDKARVLDGLEGVAATAGGGFNRAQIDDVLSGLGKRVFLMHNVHEEAPVVFHTRWAMSYLRGPLTRSQIQQLTAGLQATPTTAAPAPVQTPAAAAPPVPEPEPANDRPPMPAEVEQYFLPIAASPPSSARIMYRPQIIASAQAHYVRVGVKLDE